MMRKLTFQEGWLSGRQDAIAGRLHARTDSPKLDKVNGIPIYAGRDRLEFGDAWADGYNIGWTSATAQGLGGKAAAP